MYARGCHAKAQSTLRYLRSDATLPSNARLNADTFVINRVTEIPGPKSKALLERRGQAIPRGPFNVAPIFVKSARGAIVEDVDGNTYIDFAGGLGCLNVGSSADDVVNAIKDQAGDFSHTCFHVAMHEPYVALAER